MRYDISTKSGSIMAHLPGTEKDFDNFIHEVESNKFVKGYFYTKDFGLNGRLIIYEYGAVSTSIINTIKPLENVDEFLDALPKERKEKGIMDAF